MKNNIINPTGLKGREVADRIKELMGQSLIKENVDRYVFELTKMGPDGKAYAIVRENREYYIKTATVTENLTKGDFNYIGGLKNKKDYVYPSYAKALKHLSLKFSSINESLGTKDYGNIFENDGLLNEGLQLGVSENIDKVDGEDMSEDDVNEMCDIELSDDEQHIDEMLDLEETYKSRSKFLKDNVIVKKGMSIMRGMDVIDEAISDATGERKTEEIKLAENILNKLNRDEILSILENVTGKKKI